MSTTISSLKRVLGVVAAVILIPALWSQTATPVARIQTAVDNSRRTTLPGSRPVRANAQFDAGAMPAATRIEGVTIVFNRSAAQQADLDALIAAQQNPASPEYHRWLTPDQFGARFGMSAADLAKVETWLQQQGFSINSVAPSHDQIRFSGTVAQVEAAFAAPMHYFEVNGKRHFAPAADLSLPSAIAPTVLGVRNLDDFRPHPRAQTIHPPRANPHFTSSVSGNVFFAPGDIATTYDMKTLYAAGDDGTGQTIAVVGQSDIALSDIEDFQSAAGLTVKDPNIILMPATGDAAVFSGDEAESDLDLEWAGGIAPGATLNFVYVGSDENYSAIDALSYAIEQDLAPVVSSSYGLCELAEGSEITTLEPVLQQAATQGQTVISAAGDDGSTDCFGISTLTTAQQEALAVDYPASSAYVTGVGGTEITAAEDTTASGYWQASTGTDVINSALKYIPEVAWNDDSAANGLGASGGGASTIYTSKPTWQTGVPGIPSDGKRDVPDLAFYASAAYPGELFCTSDESAWQSGQVSSCTAGFRDASTDDLTVGGGTSVDAPMFAGMVAILNQTAGYSEGEGLVNPTLYSLAANATTYAAAFHDITTGTNDCTAGSGFCSGVIGFSAGTGYDQVTGLGSVDLGQLSLAWPQNTGTALIATTTAVTASATNPALNANDTFTITVASVTGGSVPSGTVSLNLDGSAVAPATLTANGTAVYTTSFTAVGPHQLLVQYAGDATHARSNSVITVNVSTPNSGTGTFALAASNVTVPPAGSASSTITVTPSSGYTGTVLMTLTTSNPNALADLCYQFASTNANGDGTIAVPGTAAVTTTLLLDDNAADCASGAFRHIGAKKSALPPAFGSGFPGIPKPAEIAALIILPGFALALVLGDSRRRTRLGLAALIALGVAAVACGTNNNGTTLTNPPAGPYTMTITGQDSVTSTITATTSFTFTVQ